MPILGMSLVFAAAFGFHQMFDWNIITIIFAMAMMVPGAALVLERLLRPATKARLETEKPFQVGFLVGVSMLAFLVFQSDGMAKADTDIATYAALWWYMFPYACGVLVLFDRVFNVFADKRPLPSKSDENPASPHWPFDSEADTTNVIEFDPERFKGRGFSAPSGQGDPSGALTRDLDHSPRTLAAQAGLQGTCNPSR